VLPTNLACDEINRPIDTKHVTANVNMRTRTLENLAEEETFPVPISDLYGLLSFK